MQGILEKLLTSSKFAVLLILMASATVLCALDKLTVEQWTEFAKYIGGGWIIAQGIADHGKPAKTKTPAAPPAEKTPVPTAT